MHPSYWSKQKVLSKILHLSVPEQTMWYGGFWYQTSEGQKGEYHHRSPRSNWQSSEGFTGNSSQEFRKGNWYKVISSTDSLVDFYSHACFHYWIWSLKIDDVVLIEKIYFPGPMQTSGSCNFLVLILYIREAHCLQRKQPTRDPRINLGFHTSELHADGSDPLCPMSTVHSSKVPLTPFIVRWSVLNDCTMKLIS